LDVQKLAFQKLAFQKLSQNLLPSCAMPASGAPRDQTLAWYGTDTEESYRKRGGHPTYDESSIEYKFNSHGYRCPEFTEVADIRMISIGCSFVAGMGLPQNALFHELFAEHLRRKTGKTVVNWNIAESGAGNDAVERVLHLAVPYLEPHIVLILFPGITRREYVTPKCIPVQYTPGILDHPAFKAILGEGSEWLIRLLRPIYGNLAGIASEQNDEMRFFRSYKSIEALLSDRCWLFGFADFTGSIEVRHVFKHVAMERYIGDWSMLDGARDDPPHPGPATHELLFRGFWNAFESIGGLASCAGPAL
jgi:hypothetical protein